MTEKIVSAPLETPTEQVVVKLETPVISGPVLVLEPETGVLSQVSTTAKPDTPVWERPPEEQPARVARYREIVMTEADWHELAAIVFLESANQSAEGQQAVAEVVFNRVVHPDFPNTVHDVIHQGEGTRVPQFSTVYGIDTAEPTQVQYDAIYAALYGESITPLDVVFFSRGGENNRVWQKIGDHVFCREYIWE